MSALRWIRSKLVRAPSAMDLEVRPDDIFVASYPRSGNSWTRFLLANLSAFDTDEPVDFHTVHKYVPDIDVPDHRRYLTAGEGSRLIKTHARFDPRIQRAIYIVRDGRDVMVSYYHYLRGKGRFEGTLLEFLSGPVAPCSWREHVESWLDYRKDHDVLWVRYEDVQADPYRELKRMAEFAGLPADRERIEWAVDHASADQMRTLERERGRPFGNGDRERFVRQAEVGDWKNHFGSAEIKRFNSDNLELLRTLGYQD